VSERHRLLQRQLEQTLGNEELPSKLLAFVDAVDRAYRESDEDRKLLERALDLSSQELLQANTDMRLFFDAFPDLLFRVHTDGTILDYRGRVEHMSSRSELIGFKIQETVGLSAKKEFEQALLETCAKHPVKPLEYAVVTKTGDRFCEATFLPLNGPQTIVMIRDITERKKLEGHLLQSQKLDTVGTLAGGIAHDLNNQMTPLVGYLSLLLQMVEPGDEKRQFLEEANQAAKRCKDVVQRLLNFSRPSTQKKEVVSYSLILEELRKFLPKLLPSVQIDVVYSPSLWKIQCNETEIETVFMNLAANARDAMQHGGRLSIRVENVELDDHMISPGRIPGKYVLATVKDTGGGISPETIKRIFEPFFTTKERGRGTGLGLAMVFNIVKDHNGWIDVTSEIGRGTAFEIYLPAAVTTDKSLINKNGFSEAALPRGNETILLADDEEPIRKHGKLLLEQLGYRVIQAADGEEAVQVFSESQKEIGTVILDVLMPKISGSEAMGRILTLDPRAKVILSSGFSEGSVEEYLRKGAKDFIQKPYTAFMLAQSVRKCLDSK